jgi:hypothetical protein
MSTSLADSKTPATTRPPSRPASVVSDAGSVRGHTERITALGRSNRVNILNGASTSSTLTVKKRTEGTASAKTAAALRSSVSPPPLSLKRAGVKSPTTGTRTVVTPPTARRVVSGNAKSTTMTARRASVMSPTPSISESSEKENNIDDSVRTVRRRSMVPISG